MYPIGTPEVGKGPKVRRYPYVIIPVDPPASPIPVGTMYMEAIVFSLIQHPPEKVLADYCKFKGLDSNKFRCHPVVFAKDLRESKGTIRIRRDADRFRMGVNWKE